MKYTAEIDIMPHKELLDPQGKAVQHSMGNLHITGVEGTIACEHYLQKQEYLLLSSEFHFHVC